MREFLYYFCFFLPIVFWDIRVKILYSLFFLYRLKCQREHLIQAYMPITYILVQYVAYKIIYTCREIQTDSHRLFNAHKVSGVVFGGNGRRRIRL